MKVSEITQLRKQMMLTQEDFAHELGVTASTVNRWERGESVPSRMAKKSTITVLEENY